MRDDLLEDRCCPVVIAVVDVEVRAKGVTGATIRVRWLEQECFGVMSCFRGIYFIVLSSDKLSKILPCHGLPVNHSFLQYYAQGQTQSRTGV